MTDNSAQKPEQLMLAFVHGRICSIQNDYLSASGKPRGARKLATLRHALLMPIGSNADAWPLEFEGLPAELVGRGIEPSWAETAVHAALTLYAVHQQGKTKPMYVPGDEHSFGAALRRLVWSDEGRYSNLEEGEMPRRFRAFITADSMEEALHHARQLIQQLRAAEIPVDYARFAAQLYKLQSPYTADKVRRAWGREYSRIPKAESGIDASPSEE